MPTVLRGVGMGFPEQQPGLGCLGRVTGSCVPGHPWEALWVLGPHHLCSRLGYAGCWSGRGLRWAPGSSGREAKS